MKNSQIILGAGVVVLGFLLISKKTRDKAETISPLGTLGNTFESLTGGVFNVIDNAGETFGGISGTILNGFGTLQSGFTTGVSETQNFLNEIIDVANPFDSPETTQSESEDNSIGLLDRFRGWFTNPFNGGD